MDEQELKKIIEALLLSSNEPLSVEKLLEVFDEWQRPSTEQLKKSINELQADYSERAFELIEVASGYKVQTKSAYSEWVARLQIEKPAKYSRALLETLAIIAYKQPVTRADIEEIRGVAVNSQIMKTLMEREWIRIAGHKDVPGKPAVYTTTKEFLNYFNLNYLNELPSLPEVMDTLTLHTASQPKEECVTE
ncbi:SMC-Scp complex subunit ScpB [Legionella shakespearei]|uniref:Segregation and condensation protein B n=1 Tax=Legionella shakespearei DSM 23087 TaxID=1122169 RepID=A0A0W0YUM2_9GAMM|nr:SMC-Scp complex subunit ScpB [Legionella shakespearei]KTD60539.1 segregation and condensation protein B [Legionella shakespearei DSM 23087]